MLFNRKKIANDNKSTTWEIITRTKKSASIIISLIVAGILTLSGCQYIATTNSPISNNSNFSNSINSDGNSSQSSTSVDNSNVSPSSADSSKPSSISASSKDPTPTIKIKPTVFPSPTAATSEGNKYMYINVSVANLRTQPNTSSIIIKVLHYRTRVTRLEITNDEWSKVITDNDETGYVFSEFLVPTIPQITPTSAPARILTKWPAQSTLASSFYSAKLEDYIGRTLEYEPLKGITVILDPGHGGGDPGAVSNSGFSPVYEKTINLSVALKVGAKLKEKGAEVVYTRSNDSAIGLYSRNAFINKYILEKHKKVLESKSEDVTEVNRLIGLMQKVIDSNSDVLSKNARGAFLGLGVNEDIRTIMDISREYEDILVLSIHCNSIENSSSSSGVEIYYGTNDAIFSDEKKLLVDEPTSIPLNPEYQFYNDTARKNLAVSIRDRFKNDISLTMRGNNNGLFAWNFCMLRENNLTNILIELGFISNNHDRIFLTDPANQGIMALGVANAIYDYYCVD